MPSTVGILGEQPHRRLTRLRSRRLTYHRMLGVERQAVIVQEFRHAAGALLASRGVGVAADKGDSAAAVAEEMLRGRIPAVMVLRAHVVDIHTVQAAGQ